MTNSSEADRGSLAQGHFCAITGSQSKLRKQLITKILITRCHENDCDWHQGNHRFSDPSTWLSVVEQLPTHTVNVAMLHGMLQ